MVAQFQLIQEKKSYLYSLKQKPYIISFSEDIGLLHIRYVGILTIEDISASFKEAKRDFPLPKDLLVISNFLDAETNIRYTELHKLIRPTIDVIRSHKSIYDAIITDKPKGMAFSTLFKALIKKSNVNYKIFSTVEAAQEWIMSSKS